MRFSFSGFHSIQANASVLQGINHIICAIISVPWVQIQSALPSQSQVMGFLAKGKAMNIKLRGSEMSGITVQSKSNFINLPVIWAFFN